MLSAEEIMLALAASGCPVFRIGRSKWEASCPACRRVHAVELVVSATGVYRLECLAGCSPDDVLAAMELER
jgi:hypothetical protein